MNDVFKGSVSERMDAVRHEVIAAAASLSTLAYFFHNCGADELRQRTAGVDDLLGAQAERLFQAGRALYEARLDLALSLEEARHE